MNCERVLQVQSRTREVTGSLFGIAAVVITSSPVVLEHRKIKRKTIEQRRRPHQAGNRSLDDSCDGPNSQIQTRFCKPHTTKPQLS